MICILTTLFLTRVQGFSTLLSTPSLALTSVAAATPDDWSVRYWDENLLQGSPPVEPFPAVVGITVHLTFANRAYELAKWYRERGSIVVFGGLHVLSCPEEVRPHCDVMVIGDGVSTWTDVLHDFETNTLKSQYTGSFRSSYREAPAPRTWTASQETPPPRPRRVTRGPGEPAPRAATRSGRPACHA